MEANQLETHERTIQYGDVILVMEGKETFKQIKVKKGEKIQNKNGHFSHDEFIGKKLGSKVETQSRNMKGFIILVDFIPALQDKLSGRLTQIIFNPDISMILTFLDISSNSIIYESGTGSGCLSVNIANCLSTGMLYTFEFNRERATKLASSFKELGLEDKIRITHQDVVDTGFVVDPNVLRQEEDRLCDSIFVDLPTPWLALKNVEKVLKPNGNFVSFSPCIEQVEKTFKELKLLGYLNPRMFEIMYRSYNYIKTDIIKVPVIGEKRRLTKDSKYRDEEVVVSSSKGDMRGHTGFLIHATKYS